MDYLVCSMDASIRAPGTGDGDSLIGDKGQGFFNSLLNAGAVALALPATKGDSRILYRRRNPHYSCGEGLGGGQQAVALIDPV